MIGALDGGPRVIHNRSYSMASLFLFYYTRENGHVNLIVGAGD